MTPPVFVSYRRADEPFAAALLYAAPAASWPGDPVFLDTRFLRQRGDVGLRLLAAVAGCELVLAVIGRAWDDAERRERLADPADWVRRELVAAAEAGKPVVPVLVDRDDVPAELPFAPVPHWSPPLRVDSTDYRPAVGELARRVAAVLGPPTAVPEPAELIGPAVDAMLRHVLPGPQRRMRNGAIVAGVVAGQLEERDWLRFVATANRPRRPTGSTIVWLTADRLGVADLGPDFRPRTDPVVVGLGEVRQIRRRDRHRLWMPVSDLSVGLTGGSVLDLRGFFADEATELLERISARSSRRPPPPSGR